MRMEASIFGICAAFLILVTPTYWLLSEDVTGTAALTMTALLALLITFYLGFHASKMEPRPEDRIDAEIEEGAGELGFFPPYSWWPLWCGLTLSLMVFAVAMEAWWLFIIGGVLGAFALTGWVFEYYVGEHAH
jgi:hypothetical protein